MNKKMKIVLLSTALAVAGATTSVFAHCDTMDGPTVKDAQTALATKNVNYILKWVPESAETDMKRVFAQALEVRKQGKDARELAEAYLFDNLVRIHRASEVAPFTGVKPHGTPIDERVLAADKAIETGDLAPLTLLVPAEKLGELEERFQRVMSLKNYTVNDVGQAASISKPTSSPSSSPRARQTAITPKAATTPEQRSTGSLADTVGPFPLTKAGAVRSELGTQRTKSAGAYP